MDPLKFKPSHPGWTKLKRKMGGEGPACVDDRQTKRRQIIPQSLIEGFSKLLSPRHIDDLPQEILLKIFQHFSESWVLTDDLADWEVYTFDEESKIRQHTLAALTKTCRRLNQPATSILYRCVHIPTSRSFMGLLSALYIQPRLSELVKQVSCSQEVLTTVSYVFQNVRSDPVPLNAELLRPGSRRTGLFRPIRGHTQSSNVHNNSIVHGHVLYSILKRIPAIRALSISSSRPWHNVFPVSVLPLEHLARLSITTSEQVQLDPRDPNATSDPTLTWLNKSNLGRYPALKQLELVRPWGKWIANLVTVEAANGSGPPVAEKYVTSLTTLWRKGGGSAVWELLSLGQDIFSSAHLHTLEYTGQSQGCNLLCSTQVPGWNLNRFLATTGRGIRTLSLDWEHGHAQLVQLGPTQTLTSIPMLTNLTHLTVSMQALFQRLPIFESQLKYIQEHPVAELARLLPASLRVLRISEYLGGVFGHVNRRFEDRNIPAYNHRLLIFIDVLRAYWLDAHDDRELWFRHCLVLERHPNLADEPWRRHLRWLISCQRHEDVGREFARVYHMLPGVAATFREVMAAKHAS